MSNGSGDLASAFRHTWIWLLVEGVVLVVLGATAIVLAPLASIAVAIILGWLFLVSGIFGLISTFTMREAPGFWWSLLSAVIGIVAGVLLLMSPVMAVLSLTLVLIAFFIVEGVASILFAFEHRDELPGRWGWMLVSGLIDLVLAGMIYAGLPSTATWALGLLAGINLVFGGLALIVMALGLRAATS
jgi:uncharacterized membrane protein HdeD (DUF308 family)